MTQFSLASAQLAGTFPIDFRSLIDGPRLDATANVLVIDSNALFRHAVKAMLEASGYQVVVASTSEEGLRMAVARRPDAVVVEFGLAGLDGPRFVQRLRRDPLLSRIPCLIVSGGNDPDDEVRALDAGADDFLFKTTGLQTLRHRLRSQLRRRAAEEDLRQSMLEQHRKELDRLQARHLREVDEVRQSLLAVIDRQREEAVAQRAAARSQGQDTARLLVNMSGELRTPLNAIIGFSELLNRELFGPLSDRQRDYVGQIQGGARQLLHFVNELVDVSRLDAGDLTLTATPTGLHLLIEAVAKVVQPLALEQGTELTVEIAAPLPSLMVDRTRLRQVLHNLMTCALRAAPGGSVHVEARPSEAGIVLSVRGTTKVVALNAEPQPATSLAVAVARRLVELHGGRFVAEAGAGLLVTVDLPLAPPSVTLLRTMIAS